MRVWPSPIPTAMSPGCPNPRQSAHLSSPGLPCCTSHLLPVHPALGAPIISPVLVSNLTPGKDQGTPPQPCCWPSLTPSDSPHLGGPNHVCRSGLGPSSGPSKVRNFQGQHLLCAWPRDSALRFFHEPVNIVPVLQRSTLGSSPRLILSAVVMRSSFYRRRNRGPTSRIHAFSTASHVPISTGLTMHMTIKQLSCVECRLFEKEQCWMLFIPYVTYNPEKQVLALPP